MNCKECEYFYKICGIGHCSLTDGETSPKDSCELGVTPYCGDRKDLTETTFGKPVKEMLDELKNPLEKLGYEQLTSTGTNKEWWIKYKDYFAEIIVKQSGNLRLDIPPEHLQPIMEYLRLDNEIENLKEEIRTKDYEIDCLNKEAHYWINAFNEQAQASEKDRMLIGKIRDLMEVQND